MNYITNTYPSRSVFLQAFRVDSSWSFRAFLWRPKGMFVFPINSIPSGVSVYPSPLLNRVQQGSIRKQPYHPHPLPLSPFTHPLSPETEYFSSVLLKVETPPLPQRCYSLLPFLFLFLFSPSTPSSFVPQTLQWNNTLHNVCDDTRMGIEELQWMIRVVVQTESSSVFYNCDAMIITRTVDAFTIPTGRHQCQRERMDMKGIKSGGGVCPTDSSV